MVPIQNVKMTMGPIWNTGGTEMEIIVPVSVLGRQRAGTEMGGDHCAVELISGLELITSFRLLHLISHLLLGVICHWKAENMLFFK